MRCARRINDVLIRHTAFDVRTFAHGSMSCSIRHSTRSKDEATAAARALVALLVEAGVPRRHAGSFGFDFFGCDWFEDPQTRRIGLRLSVGDLPSCLVDRAIDTIKVWLSNTVGDAYIAPRVACHSRLKFETPRSCRGFYASRVVRSGRDSITRCIPGGISIGRRGGFGGCLILRNGRR